MRTLMRHRFVHASIVAAIVICGACYPDDTPCPSTVWKCCTADTCLRLELSCHVRSSRCIEAALHAEADCYVEAGDLLQAEHLDCLAYCEPVAWECIAGATTQRRIDGCYRGRDQCVLENCNASETP